MSAPAPYPLVEAAVLAAWLKEPARRVRMVDASYALPGSDVQVRAVFERKRIGNAVFFDVDAIADRSRPLPHMLPNAEVFAAAVGALGIGNGDCVVVYDQTGLAMAAARVWWSFRVFGHSQVFILNGGLPAWELAGLPLNSGPVAPVEVQPFQARVQAPLLAGAKDILDAGRETGIIDARSQERYAGSVPEPRPGLRRGHVPDSINVPYSSLLEPDGRLKSAEQLETSLGVVKNKGRIVAYCGSGITACVIALAFYVVGRRDAAVYDGSWVEWGQPDSGLPVA